MPNRINEEWWKRCCELSTLAIAFVDQSDRFLYCNHAWSVLTGYAPAQLCGIKRWQDITEDEGVGGDQKSAEAVKEGDTDSFYLEKTYIRADYSKVPVGIYVHRHPPFGPQQGYVVFAKKVGSPEFAALEAGYAELKARVVVIEEMRRLTSNLEQRINANAEAIDDLQDLVRTMIGAKAGGSVTTVTTAGGDWTGQDKTGGNKNSVVVVLATVAVIAIAGVLVLGGKLLIDGQRVEINAPRSVEVIE